MWTLAYPERYRPVWIGFAGLGAIALAVPGCLAYACHGTLIMAMFSDVRCKGVAGACNGVHVYLCRWCCIYAVLHWVSPVSLLRMAYFPLSVLTCVEFRPVDSNTLSNADQLREHVHHAIRGKHHGSCGILWLTRALDVFVPWYVTWYHAHSHTHTHTSVSHITIY